MPHRSGPIFPEVVTAIREAYARGESIKDIVVEHAVSERSVRDFVADLPQGDAYAEALRLRILVCLDAGLDVRTTAEKCRCRISHVVRIIRAAKRASVQRRTEEERREYQRAYQAKRRAAKKVAKAIAVPAPEGLEERILASAHGAAVPPES